MANIYKGTLGLIGNTPLVEVENIEKELNLPATLLVKLEYLNPAGSVKDRIAKAMIEDAEEKGILKKGSVIIEPTSGNTGIGLAAIAAVKDGRKVVSQKDLFEAVEVVIAGKEKKDRILSKEENKGKTAYFGRRMHGRRQVQPGRMPLHRRVRPGPCHDDQRRCIRPPDGRRTRRDPGKILSLYLC